MLRIVQTTARKGGRWLESGNLLWRDGSRKDGLADGLRSVSIGGCAQQDGISRTMSSLTGSKKGDNQQVCYQDNGMISPYVHEVKPVSKGVIPVLDFKFSW